MSQSAEEKQSEIEYSRTLASKAVGLLRQQRQIDKPKPNKALADFLEACPADPPIPENSFTTNDYVKAVGCHPKTAAFRLKTAVKKGTLKCQTVRVHTSTINFYSVVEDKKRGSTRSNS